MILTDLTKVFDSLSHNLLLCKPQDLAMGTSESSTKWFESYLAKDIRQLEQAILSITCLLWSSPRSILGPLLFLLNIFRDLPNIVSNCEIESYVDHTKLFLSFKSFDTDLAIEGFQLHFVYRMCVYVFCSYFLNRRSTHQEQEWSLFKNQRSQGLLQNHLLFSIEFLYPCNTFYRLK